MHRIEIRDIRAKVHIGVTERERKRRQRIAVSLTLFPGAVYHEIEDRIDELVENWPELVKKRMFGGVCYLYRGNMAFGVWKDYLIVRTGTEAAQRFLEEDGLLKALFLGLMLLAALAGGLVAYFYMRFYLWLALLVGIAMPVSTVTLLISRRGR